jgi:hypothetical protein
MYDRDVELSAPHLGLRKIQASCDMYTVVQLSL